MNLLDALLRPSELAPAQSVGDWWRHQQQLLTPARATADIALLGGHRADRLAWAFASGYHAALLRLLPDAPRDRRLALCVTEAGGAHPKVLNTILWRDGEQLRLRGEKSFVTLGSFAERLLIIASEGEDEDGRKRLRAVWVDAGAEGVEVEDLPAFPIVPEIPHALVRLQDAPVSPQAVLAGDAWSQVVKPFRTVEDIHVNAALVGFLLNMGSQNRWPGSLIERLLALALSLRALAEAPPERPETHLALAGALELARSLLGEADWSAVGEDIRERWARDQALLRVASKAREARRAAAWEAVAHEE